MSKIMLVLDNKEDQNFLEKVLVRLRYTVIAMRQGIDLSEQLIDHFPDVVFASTLGRNEKILSALGKIKEVRGKPKLVFVRQEKENVSLSQEQKKIIDGVLYSPIDPFKLIDLLSSTTDMEIVELRKRYNEMLEAERPIKSPDQEFEDPDKVGDPFDGSPINFSSQEGDQDYGETTVFGKNRGPAESQVEKENLDDGHVVTADSVPTPPPKKKFQGGGDLPPQVKLQSTPPSQSPLINDEKRRQKYSEWEARLKKEYNGQEMKSIDTQKLRDMQSKQSREVKEDPTVKENRKHFLKTLFSMSPGDVKKK